MVACGRRFGKTETGKLELLYRFLTGGRCWWLAPTLPMAEQVWRDLKLTLAPLPEARVSALRRRIDLPGGGMLAIRSTHYADNLRGEGLDFAVLDEAAFMNDQVWPQVVRPMLLERRGDALFLSSPNGHNWFWHLYQQGLEAGQQRWQAFHFASRDNPLVDAEELAVIRAGTSERIFRAEYEAEFFAGEGALFQDLRATATAPPDAQPQPQGQYVAGVDWGLSRSYTAIVVLDEERHAVVAWDRFRRMSWTRQQARLQAMHARWGLRLIRAESNSMGSPQHRGPAAGRPAAGELSDHRAEQTRADRRPRAGHRAQADRAATGRDDAERTGELQGAAAAGRRRALRRAAGPA